MVDILTFSPHILYDNDSNKCVVKFEGKIATDCEYNADILSYIEFYNNIEAKQIEVTIEGFTYDKLIFSKMMDNRFYLVKKQLCNVKGTANLNYIFIDMGATNSKYRISKLLLILRKLK